MSGGRRSVNHSIFNITRKIMNFTDYQQKSRATAKYPVIGHGVIYPTLGLVNEAGEVAGKIKKVFPGKDGEINQEKREGSKGELGAGLGYNSHAETEFDISFGY